MKRYRVEALSTDVYYIEVEANDELEATDKAKLADDLAWTKLEPGDWTIDSVIEVE
jgi:hypothetical protein